MPLPLRRAAAATAAPHTVAAAAAASRAVAAAAAAAPRTTAWSVVDMVGRWSSVVVVVVVVIGRCRSLLMVVVVVVGGRGRWSLLSLLSLPLLSLSPSVIGRSWSVVVVGHGHDCGHDATCHGYCTPPQPRVM